jgi:pSer/pThr/pTyr-binding forkhead associated (FHA) protein
LNAAAQYRQLVRLGRDEFVAAAAPGALIRYRREADDFLSASSTLTLDQQVEQTLPHGKILPDEGDVDVYPLAKKPGASFPDRITIGRTSNNDIVIVDASVSRLHAYVRREDAGWVVADAGSKNGSWLHGKPLEQRREVPLQSNDGLRIGEVDLTFFVAADLYGALGGQ